MPILKVLDNEYRDVQDKVWNSENYPKSGIYQAPSMHGVDWVLLVSKRAKTVMLQQKSPLEEVLEDTFELNTPTEIPAIVSSNTGLSINDILRLIAIKSDSANIEDILEK